MAFCTECGANIPDGLRFCTECGKPMDEAAQSAPVMASAGAQGVARQPPTAAQPAPQSVYLQPETAPPPQTYAPSYPRRRIQAIYNGDAPPPRNSKYAVMSTGSYIGHSFLFAIPVIGWLACIIMAFASGNLNKRNFARAMLIFFLIGLVLSVALYIVFGWIMEAATEYLMEAAQGTFGDLGGL